MGSGASVGNEQAFAIIRGEYLAGLEQQTPDEIVFKNIHDRLTLLAQEELITARSCGDRESMVVNPDADPSLKQPDTLGRLVSLSYLHLDTNEERGHVVSQTLKAQPTMMKIDHTKYRRPTITRDLVEDLSMAFTIDVLVDPTTFKLLIDFAKDVQYACDRLNFWADVQNYRTLPSAQYTDRLLRKIYEKFVSPTSPTPICVPTNILAEIRAIYESPGGIQSAGVFNEAQALCKRDLEKDVFPRFRKHNLFKKMVAVFEPNGHLKSPRSLMNISDVLPDDVDSTYCFDAVLNDENKLRFFKTYCIESLTSENLIFYSEVEECKRLPNQSYIQARARKIYDTYIKEGAKRNIHLTASMHEEMTRKSEGGTFDPMIFHDAQYLVMEYVRLELWVPFRLYDRAMAIPVSALAVISKSQAQVDALIMLLHDKIAHRVFKAFLGKRSRDHCVAFIDEVDEFNTLPGIEFMHHTAKKLYKKYICDSAKLQVDMSTKLRQDIVAKLASPTIDMFKPVVLHVKQGLLRDSLLRYFKSSTFAELKLTSSDPALASEISSAVNQGNLEMPHLDVILVNPVYVGNFKKFLQAQHCVENLIFYEEVEEFRRLPSYQIVLRSAKKIIDKYINVNTSRNPIRLPEHLYDAIVTNLDQADKTYFTDAVQQVMDSLRTHDVPDFLDSSGFVALVGSWALMDEQYAIRQLIGDLELAYFRHRLYMSQTHPKTAR
ncbi:Regulator of G protein signaling [Thraustotheca clavata]|uniref:Regulator of G protein signaling n=1 Tax=Thraustotheca clavata TaxID=74557 RepID=A0A1V9Y4K2_9STRA|nr:Regulator of G protein signaling [Thraustotheca clavata]